MYFSTNNPAEKCKADKNGDGKLTPEEWRQVLNSSGVYTTM